MDGFDQFIFFGGFFEQHKAGCGVTQLDITSPDTTVDGVAIKLTCPVCGRSLRGRIRDEEMAILNALLRATGQN